MMFLVTFLIFVLIVFSTQLSRNAEINKNDPIYKNTVILTSQNKAYSILLHSITLNEYSISGYSNKFDSIMTFPVLDQNLKVIQNKLGNYPYNIHKCNICHKQ